MAMKKRFYTMNSQMMAYDEGGVTKDFLTDHLGSITAEIDQTQTRTYDTRYSAYGRNLWSTGTGCGFGWVGSYGYRETGLFHMSHYVRARHYSYVTGGWSTVDPIWPAESAYGYVSGRGSRLVDPAGLCPLPCYYPKRCVYNGPPGNESGIAYWHCYDATPGPKPVVPPPPAGEILPIIPIGLLYGKYCGPANQQPPGKFVEPIDAIDACCLAHDRCLEANYGAGKSEGAAHACCDAELGRCANKVLETGGCGWSLSCIFVARQIWKVFDTMGVLFGSPCNCVPPNFWKFYGNIYWLNTPRPCKVNDGGHGYVPSPFSDCPPAKGGRPPGDPVAGTSPPILPKI
jgi:RHS repeat-associated protein